MGMSDQGYLEQVTQDAARLRAATGMSHAEFIDALRLLVLGQMKKCEFLLADHGLPIPNPPGASLRTERDNRCR